MTARTRLVACFAAVMLGLSVLHAARGPADVAAAAIQLQLADALFGQGEYRGALGVYRHIVGVDEPDLRARARSGTVRAALRLGEFNLAATHAVALRDASPEDPATLALYGDSLWALGLFAEAEEAYRTSLALGPAYPRARHGVAKALATRNQLGPALEEARTALAAAPGDLELHHTVGYILERMRRYDEAAVALGNYLSLLPLGDRGEKVAWCQNEIAFLRSFGRARPFDTDEGDEGRQHTVPFRLVKDKIVVEARINGRETVDFAVDTGAEQTVITEKTARRLGISGLGQTLSAGVGLIGFRGMQIARLGSVAIGSLRVRNVPCLIKTPAISGLPMGELESLSPLAMGLSVQVDYRTRRLTLGPLPVDPSPAVYEMPLRMHRLATVQGMVNQQPASFIVDTGGEVISVSSTTARSLFRPAERRRIALRVYGTSGLDPDAYLMPGVTLAFDKMTLSNQSVVVLNLRAPSVLLGYQIGGILGHKLLGRYRVEIDLERSVLRLRDL